jgi:Uma2 family endonuclease
MPNAEERVWTVEEVWALPSDARRRYEVVDGTLLMTPAPSLLHQRAVRALLRVLHDCATTAGVGEAIPAPFDVVLDGDTPVQPDVCVVPQRPDLADAGSAAAQRLPLLAVEVLPPPTARYDRLVKRARYQRAGIEYWIVDIDAQLVERWTPEAERPEMCSLAVRWQPKGFEAVCLLDVETLMTEVHGARRSTP